MRSFLRQRCGRMHVPELHTVEVAGLLPEAESLSRKFASSRRWTYPYVIGTTRRMGPARESVRPRIVH
jgi:hypothetical protein